MCDESEDTTRALGSGGNTPSPGAPNPAKNGRDLWVPGRVTNSEKGAL